MSSFQGVSPHHQWTSSGASQAPHQPLVGPKQGAILLKQLANSYKRPAQPPRRGLRGGQSHPNKHYAGIGKAIGRVDKETISSKLLLRSSWTIS